MSKIMSFLALALAALALVLVFTISERRQPAPEAEASAAPAAAATQGASEAEAVQKVVWHADFADPRRFSAMLTSINNMVTTFQNDLVDYDVRIVFVSHGIRFVTEDKLEGTPFAEDQALAERRADLMRRLRSLQEVQGVKLELCDITREAIGLDKEKLIPGVALVRSGVVRISELQKQGFAYLKVE